MVDASKAKAEVENGVLKIEIPKTEAEKPKVTQVTYSTLGENARFLERVKELRENTN